jgi:RNA polymerase sigma-70 factor (ECF subfamily)
MIDVEKIAHLQTRIARLDDQYAYKELFASLYNYLFHFARTLVKSKESAEEIVSDVFIKVWEKRKELETVENLKVYLYVSTRNTAFNYLEKQKRNATAPIIEFAAAFTSVYLNPEQLMISADTLVLIQKAIDQLPPKCRTIFKLVKEDGLKYREVAEVLELSLKTVENQLAIALHKISKAIASDRSTALPSTGSNHL